MSVIQLPDFFYAAPYYPGTTNRVEPRNFASLLEAYDRYASGNDWASNWAGPFPKPPAFDEGSALEKSQAHWAYALSRGDLAAADRYAKEVVENLRAYNAARKAAGLQPFVENVVDPTPSKPLPSGFLDFATAMYPRVPTAPDIAQQQQNVSYSSPYQQNVLSGTGQSQASYPPEALERRLGELLNMADKILQGLSRPQETYFPMITTPPLFSGWWQPDQSALSLSMLYPLFYSALSGRTARTRAPSGDYWSGVNASRLAYMYPYLWR